MRITDSAEAPNADRFGVAPCMVDSISNSDMAVLDSDPEFFRWAFAWPIRRSLDPAGEMVRNYQLASKAGMELSIYEFSHHTTGGDAPLSDCGPCGSSGRMTRFWPEDSGLPGLWPSVQV